MATTPPPSAPAPPPPALPVTTFNAQSQPPIATPAFRAFITHLSETIRTGLSNRRPWTELLDRNAFTKPESLTEASLRIRKNYAYFRINYLSLIAVVVTISLLTNPFSLILLIALLAAWLFLYLFRSSDQPLVLFGRTFSEPETLGMLILVTTGVVFLTSVGSVLMSAVLVGFSLVSAHGAFRVPEDFFLDDQEGAAGGGGGGILSLLGSAASNAAATIPVPRV
ncbi:unnamed protein product [Rhodiola kirilowii]